MAQKFSKESVDMIYENTKRIAFREGFRAGYKKCKQDVLKIIKEKL